MNAIAQPFPLTQPDPQSLNARMSANPAGMAWLAGTGPEGKTCRECAWWKRVAHHRYGDDHRLKPRGCAEYTRQMRRTLQEVEGADVPADTAACRHFGQHDAPQPAMDPAFTLASARAGRAAARKARNVENAAVEARAKEAPHDLILTWTKVDEGYDLSASGVGSSRLIPGGKIRRELLGRWRASYPLSPIETWNGYTHELSKVTSAPTVAMRQLQRELVRRSISLFGVNEIHFEVVR